MISTYELHWKNWTDAVRALEYLDKTEGEGKPVARHALIAIRERSKYVLDEIELGERL